MTTPESAAEKKDCSSLRMCSTPECGQVATHCWHDAGPFGAGTFFGCGAHREARAVHTFDPGFSEEVTL